MNKTWNGLVVFCLILFSIVASAQEGAKEKALRQLIEEATEFDESNELLDADTTLLLQVVASSQREQLTGVFIEAHRCLGDYFLANSQYSKAIDHYQTALKETAKLPDSDRENYLLELRKANCYQALGRFQQAEDLYLKLLTEIDGQLAQETSNTSRLLIDKCDVLSNLGNTYSFQGRFDEAIEVMTRAYELVKKEDYTSTSRYESEKKGTAFSLGAAYLFKGDGKSARPYILEHLNYVKEGDQDVKTLARSYGNLAYCDFLLKDFPSAYRNYEKSLDISEKNNFSSVSLVTYKDLSDTYQQDGQFKKSIQYLNKYNTLKDSLQGIEVQQNFDNLRVEFETEKKEQEITKLSQQNQIAKQQRLLLTTALALAILAMVFAIVFYRNLNKNRKKEAELQALKLANLNQELHYKKQDVTRLALEISNKQELAEQLSDQIKQLEPYVQSDAKPFSRKLSSLIKSHLQSTEEQKVFHENVEAINHAFFDKLAKKFPDLNKSERELCSYIRLGLSNKEISALRNVSPEAIRSSRFRLRKKLQVESKEDVEVFLQDL